MGGATTLPGEWQDLLSCGDDEDLRLFLLLLIAGIGGSFPTFRTQGLQGATPIVRLRERSSLILPEPCGMIRILW